MDSDLFENNLIRVLEDYIQNNNNVKPLSEDFFKRIEALKEKALQAQSSKTDSI